MNGASSHRRSVYWSRSVSEMQTPSRKRDDDDQSSAPRLGSASTAAAGVRATAASTFLVRAGSWPAGRGRRPGRPPTPCRATGAWALLMTLSASYFARSTADWAAFWRRPAGRRGQRPRPSPWRGPGSTGPRRWSAPAGCRPGAGERGGDRLGRGLPRSGPSLPTSGPPRLGVGRQVAEDLEVLSPGWPGR